MKYDGKKMDTAFKKVLAIPYNNDKLIIEVKAVLDYSDFRKLCPSPEAPEVIRPGNIRTRNTEDPRYKQQVDKWSENRANWMILKSLEDSKIEFEKVDMSNPDTWGNYFDELKEVLPDAHVTRIINACMDVNGLDEEKIKEATESFLQERAAEPKE